MNGLVVWLDEVRNDDVARVGGKNASLGEMIAELSEAGVRVPDGFATTVDAFHTFLDANDLDRVLAEWLARYHGGEASLAETGEAIRGAILEGSFPPQLDEAIAAAYQELGARCGDDELSVAVRSSATAEDLPDASFAGQQESFLNVQGLDDVLAACKRCYASLFTDRAIAYRDQKGFDHREVGLSVGVQQMVRADLGGAGVAFTLDPTSGFPDVVHVNAGRGLGESVVAGRVCPDEYMVYKPFLDREGLVPIIQKSVHGQQEKLVYAAAEGGGGERTVYVETSQEERITPVLEDEEILELARSCVTIERHYGRPMDVEWAKDGRTGEIFVVQARPETVESQRSGNALKTYELQTDQAPIVTGLGIGNAVVAAPVCVLEDVSQIDRFVPGSILVTSMTDPDWVPVMKQAAGIVTDLGGRTSHASIVSRELGVPAIVGAEDATARLEDGQVVTLSCGASDEKSDEGRVYEGSLPFITAEVDLEAVPSTQTRMTLNIASPSGAMKWWRLPCEGVGLARMEYIVNNVIQAHPLALLRPDEVEDPQDRAKLAELTRGWEDPAEYFVETLARGIATIAASQYPHQVLVRMSDFKTNEYADLVGGRAFEPDEENPMLGWRGASRYYSEGYRDAFALECQAIRRVREVMGFDNVTVMIPFCRTLEEADRVIEELEVNGLRRGDEGLELYVMAEVPSNILLAEGFAERFDGFSIGSNDLTQLVLGVDRDAGELAYLFDERDEAVKTAIRHLIEVAHRKGCKVGICGQAPSDFPDFARFLVEEGIDSISLNPDSILSTVPEIASAERDRASVADVAPDRLDPGRHPMLRPAAE